MLFLFQLPATSVTVAPIQNYEWSALSQILTRAIWKLTDGCLSAIVVSFTLKLSQVGYRTPLPYGQLSRKTMAPFPIEDRDEERKRGRFLIHKLSNYKNQKKFCLFFDGKNIFVWLLVPLHLLRQWGRERDWCSKNKRLRLVRLWDQCDQIGQFIGLWATF